MKRFLYTFLFIGFALVAVAVTTLALLSLLRTYVYNPTPPEGAWIDAPSNSVVYSAASFVLLVLTSVLVVWKRTRIVRLLEAVSDRSVCIALFAWICFAGILWSYAIAGLPPIDDELRCYEVAMAFAAGGLQPDSQVLTDYFSRYPYQAGFSLWIFGWSILFKSAVWGVRLVNALCAGAIGILLVRITKYMFNEPIVSKCCAVLIALFAPLIMLTDFFYGTIPSLFFALSAVRLQQLSLHSDDLQKRCAVLVGCLLCSVASVWLKSNSMIIVIAIALIFVLSGLSVRKVGSVCFGVVLIVVVVAMSSIPSQIVSDRVEGFDDDKAMPSIAWIAMGMQDGPRAEGWYNGYIADLYHELDGDQAQISDVAMTSIRERGAVFAASPLRCLSFFGRKIATEWCDPTFEAFVYSFKGLIVYHDWELNPVSKSLFDGLLHRTGVLWCDVYQSSIYLLALLGLLSLRRKLKVGIAIFALIFLGGFLCHIFWEAKSLYVLQYFLCLLPYAALGLVKVLTFRNRLPSN